MTVTINGSTGISSPGGDTSTSLSTGLLTVTGSTAPANGMYLPGTNILGFATNSSERVRIDASGNVAIGASAASSGLQVEKSYSVDTDGAASKWTARFKDTSAYGLGKGGSLLFTGVKSSGGSGGNFAGIAGLKENATDNNEQGYLAFYTTPSTGIITERARIDSSGTLLIGQTTNPATSSVVVKVPTGTGNGVNAQITSNTGTSYPWSNYNASGTYVGGISCTSSATAFPTSSDERLKENVQDASDTLNALLAVKIRSFDWKIDGAHQEYGVVAQEIQPHIPEAILVSPGEGDYLSVDYTKIVPRLVKAIQELTARLEALEGAK